MGVLPDFAELGYVCREGVWESESVRLSDAQKQTGEVFGHKWRREDSFGSAAMLRFVRQWCVEKYGDFGPLLESLPPNPVVLDAGCGAAQTALEYFGPYLGRIRYVGVDVSEAVFVARKRFAERGFKGIFLRDDITRLPLAPGSADCIFSEGVLHHTDSTRGALASLTRLLGRGVFLFYVYNKKGPIREFSDDHIRERLWDMKPEEAWEALRPLTVLGVRLGEADCELDLPEGIPLLDVPAGKVSLQRFFYWHIFKVFYNPDLSFEEMLHINFEWYAPKNAHRQTPDEVRVWCEELGLAVERMHVENAGITVVARKYGN
jgi:SAM-dependent methyltransferase